MNIHQIRGYCSRLLESYCKNQPTSVILFLLMILPWQIHLLISLPARLIKYIMGLLEGKYALGLPLLTSKFVLQSFVTLLRLPWRKLKKFSRKPLSKSCELDPLPAVVLKGCLTVLNPTIMRIINLSLSTGVVPDALKGAILSPH